MSHSITLVNKTDGSIEGHRAGCADITRRTRNHADEPWTLEVDSKHDAYLEYNADFIAESDTEEGHWPINWLPCADHVPAEKKSTFIESLPTIEVVEDDELVVKTGRKWTTITEADGTLVAEIRNDQLDAVFALLRVQRAVNGLVA